MDESFKFRNIFKVFVILNFLYMQVKPDFVAFPTNRQKHASSARASSFAEQQLQLLKLYNNLNCFRKEDQDLKNISNSFNPLDNLNLYPNPDDVRYYFQNVSQGAYQGLKDPFTNAPEPRDEMVLLFDIFFVIEDDWELFYKTAAYALQRVNSAQIVWAMGTLLSTKFKGFKTPPFYEIFPQLFTPKSMIRKANGESDNTVVDNNPENVLKYFRHDPSINTFHTAWHTDFPFWWLPEKYGIVKGRKGELFLYMHHNLLNRYKAERLSNKLSEVKSVILDKPIEEGDVPDVLNVNYKEFPSRVPNAIIQDAPGTPVKQVESWASRIRDGISQGHFVDSMGTQIPIRNEMGANILGDTIESSEQSVDQDYYGSLHNTIHRLIAEISDPNGTLNLTPGIEAHIETAIQDPVFFRIHSYVDDFYRAEKSKLNPYARKDLQFSTVDITTIKIVPQKIARISWLYPTTPILSTFFEDFTYGISNGVKSCDEVNSGREYKGTVKRLNHRPFDYVITAFSQKSGDTKGIVRIYMSPYDGYDGKPFSTEDLYWNMFEMDRFPITLKQGVNMFTRSSQNSSVTIPDRPGFNQLIKETKEALSKDGGSPFPERVTRQCGYPLNLLLPKGTKEGMRFKMFVMITDTSAGDYDEMTYPSVPLCGNPMGNYPDGKPMGFPFDRKVSFGFSLPWFIHDNYKFLDLIVQHES